VHYYWLVKSDLRKPVFYGTMVALLLAYRLGNRLLRKGDRARSGSSAREPLALAEKV